MFRRMSLAPKGSDPTSPTAESPPGSPTSQFHQLPSGSRFTEGTASAVLSETASETSSLDPSIQYVPAWRQYKQPARLQKFRRTTAPAARYLPGDDGGTDDSWSVVTGSSWTMADLSVPEGAVSPAPPLPKRSVSFCPAPNRHAESFSEDSRLRFRSTQSPPLVLLRCVASDKSSLVKEVLHTSFPANLDLMRDIIPRRNGLVGTAIEAYNNHRGLIIRPDDVWLAIMTQFSFFVNGNSESLRKSFVAHEGKRELVVEWGGSRFGLDMPLVIERLMALMEENIADPALRAWIMPDFTTTTEVDKTTCAIVMMGMMKDYFTYKFNLRCGIPKVTIEGEKEDWETILSRIEHLKKYGIQTIAWYHLLRPILTRFIGAYDDPNHQDNLDFWNKIAHREFESGPQWLSGWITAFCVFNERGEWQGDTLNEERVREHEPKKLLRPADPLQLTPSQFAAVYMELDRDRAPYLALDGFPYPTIDSQDTPAGYVSLDVHLDDNGDVMETMFIAGSIGSQICSTTKTELFRNGLRDTVRPVTAWWYVVKLKEGEKAPGDGWDD